MQQREVGKYVKKLTQVVRKKDASNGTHNSTPLFLLNLTFSPFLLVTAAPSSSSSTTTVALDSGNSSLSLLSGVLGDSLLGVNNSSSVLASGIVPPVGLPAPPLQQSSGGGGGGAVTSIVALNSSATPTPMPASFHLAPSTGKEQRDR